MFMRTATAPSMRSADEIGEPVGRSLKRVLVAVDRFDTQSSAVNLAAALATEHGAQIFVVHVREHEHFGRASFDLETPDEANYVLDAAVSDLRRKGVEASGRVVRALVGQTAAAILLEAANVGADEIVIGSKRSGSLFGRRTRERLLRRSTLPILVAPRPGGQPGSGTVTKELHRRHAA
jgi:nucleotide-binding universal stress UspA family protein